MADVVRVHLNGVTYTHATATTVDDAAVADLARALRLDQTIHPQTPLVLQVKADAGVAALQVYPQRVWAFAAWASPASTTTGTAGSGISVGVAL